MPVQLTLGIQLRDDQTLASFYPGNDQQLHEYLNSFCTLQHITNTNNNTNNSSEQYIYLYGASDYGKTHLLTACCHAVNAQGGAAGYLPLSDHNNLHPDMLEGFEQLQLIALDDVDAVADQPDWQEQLFHLYNRVMANNHCRLIISASVPAAQLAIQLPDLKSRLTQGVVFALNELSDENKLAALQLRAEQRGMNLSESVGEFLLRRVSRNMSKLMDVLQVLDDAQLHAKRKLTLPFVKEVLDL